MDLNIPAGKTLGQMTPAERDAVIKEAVVKFQAELDIAGPRISALLAEDEEDPEAPKLVCPHRGHEDEHCPCVD